MAPIQAPSQPMALNRCHCSNRRHRTAGTEPPTLAQPAATLATHAQLHCRHRANLQLHWQHKHRANLQLHCRHRANLQLQLQHRHRANLQLHWQHRHRWAKQLHCRANLQLPQHRHRANLWLQWQHRHRKHLQAQQHFPVVQGLIAAGVDVDALIQLLQVAKQVQSEDPAASKPAPVPVAPNQSAAAVLPGAPQHPPSPPADKHLRSPASETAQAIAAPGMPPGPATVAPPGVVPVIPKKINSNIHPREFAEYRRFCCNDPCAKEMSAVWQNLT